ncbi:hypothetical protein [Synechococcus sp. CS-603]|uniref:hypothetical protein n=1 Tax=Synechococcus sp. CS-603 TaxID=2847981 RepID=UPI00223BF455|nr:hypothetical protein [Synechococcus sp. CS-603]MCT0203191.1 hypothetical protein [Synechococcus sp. CS-603]MCT4364524.1 hypothetical protein [Candidatus Regnicoccus frigidus MAG-AL1]
MGLCVVVVLEDRSQLNRLRDQLSQLSPAPKELVAVGAGETSMDAIEQLNPAIARRNRQQGMVRWLMPFGFFAGLMFSLITNLHTFAFAGSIGEPLIGGLLGMGSGWMGSYAAAASVSSETDDRVRSLRNRIDEGNWLLLLESASGEEIPWILIQQARPKAVVRLTES